MSSVLTCSQTSPVLTPLDPLEVFESIHTGPGAVLSLCRKTRAGWENLGSIPLTELREKLPSLRRFLKEDAYFAINSTYPQ
jgi:hypothetical protein